MKKERIISSIMFFLILFLFWIILSVPSRLETHADWLNLRQHIIAGVVIASLLTLLLKDVTIPSEELEFLSFQYLFRFAIYSLLHLKEIFLSALDVTVRVWKPSLPISPMFVSFHTCLKDEWHITVNANSITLTPGTITVDVKKTNKGSRFLVHCISKEGAEDAKKGYFVPKIERLLLPRKDTEHHRK